MADDELSSPLGQNAKKKEKAQRFTLPVRIPHLIAGVLGLFVLICAGWALVVETRSAASRWRWLRPASTPPRRGQTRRSSSPPAPCKARAATTDRENRRRSRGNSRRKPSHRRKGRSRRPARRL